MGQNLQVLTWKKESGMTVMGRLRGKSALRISSGRSRGPELEDPMVGNKTALVTFISTMFAAGIPSGRLAG